MKRYRHQHSNGSIYTNAIIDSPRAMAISIDCCMSVLRQRNVRLDEDFTNFIFEIVPAAAVEQLAKELKVAGFGQLLESDDEAHLRRRLTRGEPVNEKSARRSSRKPFNPREFAERLWRALRDHERDVMMIVLGWLKRQKDEFGHRQPGQRDELSKRVNKLARMFRLSPCASDLFFSLYLLTRQRLHAAISFNSNFSGLLERVNFLIETNRWPAMEVRQELMTSSALLRYKLLDHDLDLSFHTVAFLEGLSQKPLISEFFGEVTGKPLPLEAHADFAADVGHLKKLLIGRRPDDSLNLLFYGTPGTGKTELARSLGHALGFKTYEIKGMDADCQRKQEQFRLSAIYACLYTADLEKGLIIVDEADDILNCSGDDFFPSSLGAGSGMNSGDKGSLNYILDHSGTSIIWITNSHRRIEESTRRRFDYSVEFTRFTKAQRLRVWQTSLIKHRLGGLTDADIEKLANEHAINAGGIELAVRNAIRTLRADGVRNLRQARREDILAAMRPTIQAHMRITGVAAASEAARPATAKYSLEGLNIQSDQPLSENVEILRAFSNHLAHASTDHSANDVADEVRNMNVLLYGPPGTGKTEFAKYLSRELGRPLHVRLASDLLDKYVGESEKQIRAAFQEAERERAVLLLDEADSLLHSRGKAQRSWEVSSVNEILANMESFRGILVCTTNFKENLDPASLRRFNLKIAFDYLTAEGSLSFYRRMLASMVNAPLDASASRRIAELGRLTPGDFKVVRQKYGFMPKDTITHARLLDALACEAASRNTVASRPRMGFIQESPANCLVSPD
jgi:SpoVK/Ycf46/Vps4 family AAA+-type ATPase